jgi:hypothetical protein
MSDQEETPGNGLRKELPEEIPSTPAEETERPGARLRRPG